MLGAVGAVQAVVIVLIATARQGGPSSGAVIGSGRLELVVVFALGFRPAPASDKTPSLTLCPEKSS